MSGVHSLADLLAYRHAVVRDGDRVPRGEPDLFLWAANGVFVRGGDPTIDVILRIAETPPIPGLAHLMSGITWTGWAGPLPERLLDAALDAARAACRTATGGWRPAEWQGYVVLDPFPRLIAPVPTHVSAVRVEAPRPTGIQVAVDLHSHHGMPAFFSATDDQSDAGVGVSAVIGTVDAEPTIRCRLNIDGWHQEIRVTQLFEGPGPFVDVVGLADHARRSVR